VRVLRVLEVRESVEVIRESVEEVRERFVRRFVRVLRSSCQHEHKSCVIGVRICLCLCLCLCLYSERVYQERSSRKGPRLEADA
jgi:hypothetical protein